MFEAKNVFLGIILMLKKYTIFNLTLNDEVTIEREDYQAGIILLPILGLIAGIIAFFISMLRLNYDSNFVSILIMIFYCVFTKNTNLIATYTTLNTIIKPKSQSEQISGIIGVVIICLAYYTLFSLVPLRAILVTPMIGFSTVIIISSAVKRDKTGTDIMQYCSNLHICIAFFISFVVTMIISYRLVIAVSVTYIVSAYVLSMIDRKVKNLPVQVEGFIIEISQIIFLTATYLFYL